MATREGKNRLWMEKNGVVKELDVKLLPDNVIEALEEAYDKTKIVGFSKQRYGEVAEFTKEQTTAYFEDMRSNGGKTEMEAAKTFATNFGIFNDMPMLFDALCLVNSMALDEECTSKDVNCREIVWNLNNWTVYGCSYARVQKEFKEWKENPFNGSGMHVGWIRFLKYFFSLVKYKEFDVAVL